MEKLCRKLCRFLDPSPWALTTPEGFPSPPSKEGRKEPYNLQGERKRSQSYVSPSIPLSIKAADQPGGEDQPLLSSSSLSTGHFPGERGGIRQFKTIIKRQISSGNGREFLFSLFYCRINNVDFCATAGKSTLRVELYEDASWQGMKLAPPSLRTPPSFPFSFSGRLKRKGGRWKLLLSPSLSLGPSSRNNRIQETFLLWEITQPWMEPCPGTIGQLAKEKGTRRSRQQNGSFNLFLLDLFPKFRPFFKKIIVKCEAFR